MENFNIINDEGKRLLEGVDTSALESFLADYQEKIVENEELQTPDEIREYFQDLITNTLAPEKVKSRAKSQIDSYLRGYQLLDEILSTWTPELTENRPKLYDILGVPFYEYEIRRALPTIHMNLLLQSPEIPGLFLGEYSEEEKIRTLQAFIAKKLHPLGIDKSQYAGDYIWESSDSIYDTSQNIHGDVYFSRHKKIDTIAQQELFSAPSTVTIDGTTFESLSIYQYTNTLVSLLCLYALKTGYIPEELESWREIISHTRPHIPNATVSDGIDDDPKHIAIMAGWKYAGEITSTDGEYLFIGTNIYSQPGSDRHVTTAFHGDSLIFMRDDPRGEIEFSFQNGAKKARFQKTFEFKQEDIGPALVALFHLPGRSYGDNLKILNAFDWAIKNGYMQSQK